MQQQSALNYRSWLRSGTCSKLLLLILLVGTLRPSLGQADSDALGVSLVTSMANVGTEVVYPLYLEKGEKARQVQSLSLQLQFPSNLLNFVRLETGFLLEGSDIEVHGEVKEADGGSSILLLKLTDKESTPDGIPEGLLLYLTFQVDASTPLDSEIPFENQGEATGLEGGQPAEVSVRFPKAVIPVSPRTEEDEILFACFFYMH